MTFQITPSNKLVSVYLRPFPMYNWIPLPSRLFLHSFHISDKAFLVVFFLSGLLQLPFLSSLHVSAKHIRSTSTLSVISFEIHGRYLYNIYKLYIDKTILMIRVPIYNFFFLFFCEFYLVRLLLYDLSNLSITCPLALTV